MNVELITRNITLGLWPLGMADVAYKKGLITQEQRDDIIRMISEQANK